MADKIILEIVTPERKVVSETVDIVVAPGEMGEFGVLPGHIAFLCKLRVGELRYRQGAASHQIAVMGGYAEVLNNQVTILATAAEAAVEIDVIRAKAARERAERRLAESKDKFDFVRAQAALQRALARLKIAER
ncbi:MAG: F0F1 ATP synthase subunit epsilon [Syntrophobacteraceae bacterium]|nr:F0F1 ATP synthase subunit epsilon [Syntrophobacteraceae bacterium]